MTDRTISTKSLCAKAVLIGALYSTASLATVNAADAASEMQAEVQMGTQVEAEAMVDAELDS